MGMEPPRNRRKADSSCCALTARRERSGPAAKVGRQTRLPQLSGSVAARWCRQKEVAVANVWLIAALWIGLALAASVLSVWLTVSVALTEIVVGAVAGNLLHLQLNDWINWLAGFGAILLTFLAGVEIDQAVIRRNFWSTMCIGAMGFFAPYIGVLLFAHFVYAWPWPQAQIAGISLSTTSVAGVYAVMIEPGFNQTEIGKIILAACFVNDLGTVLALGVVFANYNLWLIGFAAATVVILFLLPRLTPWFFAW